MTNRTEGTTERDRMHALALSTANRIELQATAMHLLDSADGSTLRECDHTHADMLQDARALLDMPAIDADTDVADGLEDARDAIRFDGPLSLEANGTNDGRNGWQVDGCTILLGTGGPHVEVQWSFHTARIVAYGWFGADRVELPVDVDAVESLYGVSDWLDSLAGG